MTMLNTLLLDREAWDLVLDSSGNIAMASPPYSLAQDVASAVRLFLGELYYNTTKGIPYFEQVLGQLPPVGVLVQLITNAALTVPGVVRAQCVIDSFKDREITGQVRFVTEAGVTGSVDF